MTRHIPESRYSVGKRDAEVVELTDIRYEYALLSAQLELVRNDPGLVSAGGEKRSDWILSFSLTSVADTLLAPTSVILQLAQANQFDTAIHAAQSLNIDMTELFEYLTIHCLRLALNPDLAM